jgi:hypothetical protein
LFKNNASTSSLSPSIEDKVIKRTSSSSVNNLNINPTKSNRRNSRESFGSNHSADPEIKSVRPSILASSIDEHSQLESCSSTKLLGYIYLPSTEATLVKSALFHVLYCVLEIKPLADKSENPALEGFSWEICRKVAILEKLHGKDSVKFATVPSLVHRLATVGLSTDHDFLTDFLRTYRYFASAVDIARLLIMIYIRSNEIAQEKINDGEAEVAMMGAEEITTHVKMRILNLFKKWISDQEHDFAEDHLLCGILATFLSSHVSVDSKRAPYAHAMIAQL